MGKLHLSPRPLRFFIDADPCRPTVSGIEEFIGLTPNLEIATMSSAGDFAHVNVAHTWSMEEHRHELSKILRLKRKCRSLETASSAVGIKK